MTDSKFSHNHLLSIAGLDPSAGAGILADVKTFETHRLYGFVVCTGLTFQNDVDFYDIKWIDVKDIIRQTDVLYERFTIDWIKIGLIENLEVLEEIINYLKSRNPKVKIIWDPILKASAGFIFHDQPDRKKLLNICKKLYLITPNSREIKTMFPEMEEQKAGEYLSRFCSVFLKSWKTENREVIDILYNGKEKVHLFGKMINTDKHGTGCIFSSAVLANLAQGKSLLKSCQNAKSYVSKFRASDKGKLGFHYYDHVT
ncbi:MAG: hydroxymethylpyrimidine/phosphomethylpyrimidine kinase [Bacteroidota bacterium]